MLRHAVPSGDEGEVLDRALTALLHELARKKFAATHAPCSARGGTPESRHIPAEVKRTVWIRDLGRCAFVGEGGRRCDERGFLEFHHRRPYAAGGVATITNIELRCRGHNAHEAVLLRRAAKSRAGQPAPEQVAGPHLSRRRTADLFQNKFTIPT